MTPTDTLRACLDAAIAAALPARVVPPHLPRPGPGRTIVVGAGKASAAMAAALEEHWPGALTGLVITRYGHAVPCDRIEIVEAAHPVPDAAGTAAAARMLDLVRGLSPEDQVIALISGGGSALLTLMPPGVSQDDRAALNRALLASGAPIDAMNCIRRHLSRTAGGRLAAAAWPAAITSLLISDVPGDDPINIASGPTVADPTTLADARALADRYDLRLPPALMAALNDPTNESVKPGDPRLARSEIRMIATPKSSLEAAAQVARAAGWDVEVGSDRIEGEARETGRAFARDARARQPGRTRPLAILTGGETTVTLPRDGRALGSGGRNVDFLLGFAEAADGAPGLWALAADTDGIDGAAEVAGAIVTPQTLAAPGRRDLLARALHAYDGHGFFAATGDRIVTGPTLTNVNDFRAVLIAPPD